MSLKMALLVAFLLPLPLLASELAEKKSPLEKKEKVDPQVDWSKVPPEKNPELDQAIWGRSAQAKTDGIAGLLLDFGEKSQDVLVEVNLALHLYLARKGKNDDVLLAAFIIGNVHPQVVGKTKQKKPLPGRPENAPRRLQPPAQTQATRLHRRVRRLGQTGRQGLEEVIAKHTKAEEKEEKK
jgi:hypothetical protein